jgi:hypothetical protein
LLDYSLVFELDDRVSDLRREICRAGSGKRSIARQAGLPDCAFMTDECADPVS